MVRGHGFTTVTDRVNVTKANSGVVNVTVTVYTTTPRDVTKANGIATNAGGRAPTIIKLAINTQDNGAQTNLMVTAHSLTQPVINTSGSGRTV